MSQIANIVIADGQSTPVNHTFSVLAAQSGDTPSLWRDTASSTVVSGQYRMSMRVYRSTTADKVQIRVTMPKLSTDGTLTKVHQNLAVLDLVLPDTADIQERKDILAFMKNALANSIIIDAVYNGSPAY